jgi:hypothetical protein
VYTLSTSLTMFDELRVEQQEHYMLNSAFSFCINVVLNYINMVNLSDKGE